MVLAFFLVEEIQVFSARKQMSFRRRIFPFIPTMAAFNLASKMAAKLSFQTTVPDLLEFAGSHA